MAYSYVTYNGDNSTKIFTIPFPYIVRANVEVYLDGVLKTSGTDYTFLSDSSISFVTAPGSGVAVRIARNTQKTTRLVDFQDASILTEASLDLDSNQLLYITQEGYDNNTDALKKNPSGVYDAESRRIINVANPVNAQDAVPRGWAEANKLLADASAAAADASAVSAAGSASSASSSAASASTSASNAATSASNAATSASTATTKASEANTSAINAASSASSASTSATNAASSASSASSSASTATTKASEASSSAANAASSASAASTSASNAASSASAAAASYDSFDDRYLGPKASAPSLDNDGNALLTGALYFNTSTNGMFVYTGSAWVTAAVVPSGVLYAANNLSDVANAATARSNLGAQAALGYTPLNKAGDTMTGGLNTAVSTQNVNYAGAAGSFEVRGNETNGAVMSFHRTSAYGINMGLDTDNQFRIGGWSGLADAFVVNPANGDLSVAGVFNVGVGRADSWIWMYDSNEGNRAIHCNANQIGFLTQSSTWGAYCDDTGNWVASGNITAYSDSRLKRDLEVIPNALDKVQQLTGYTYTRIDSGVRQTGLIAQDVQAVLPEAVDDQGEHLSLAYGNLVGLLVEAIKEQQKQIDELKAKVL